MNGILDMLEAKERYEEMDKKRKERETLEELKKALYALSNEELKTYLSGLSYEEYIGNRFARKVAKVLKGDDEKYGIFWDDMQKRIDAEFGKPLVDYVYLRIKDGDTGWEHEVPLKKYMGISAESQKELDTFDDLKRRIYYTRYNELLRDIERGSDFADAVNMIVWAINKTYKPDEATNQWYLQKGIRKLESLAGIEIISYSVVDR